jgi:hypothetical protein
MSTRVFISSVMRDFGLQRAAAKEAVIRLRQEPVMAEDFGAQPISSQTACLEGVRTSGIYVGIFGNRYGYVAPSSGLAATDEEFNEARRRGLPILCFEQKGDKEPAQAAFLQRIKDYETGYAIVFFDTPDELKMLVVQAIHDLIGQPGITTLEPATAVKVMDRHQWGSRRADQYGTWLGAVLVPARQGERFLDVLEFSQRQRQDAFLQPAVFGPGSLFDLELGVQRAEAGEALIFRQGEHQRSPVAALEIHADGTLVYGSALRREANAFQSIGFNFVIDQDETERQLSAFAAYAGQFYQSLERGDLITSLFFGTSLTGIDNKSFGKLPAATQTGFTIPSHGLRNPLNVPDSPLRVSRAELADPAALARKMTEHIARVFRNANAYYSPGQSSRRGSAW